MKNKRIERRKYIIITCGVIATLIVVLVLVLLLDKPKDFRDETKGTPEPTVIATEGTADGATPTPMTMDYDSGVYYNGHYYEYNDNLFNMVFLGIDKKDKLEEHSNPGMGGQADCIILISFDRETKTAKLLQINRDSMVPVDKYDSLGNYMLTERKQLATQYAYGNGKEFSAVITKDAVSKLLFGTPIENYFVLDLSAISVLNDAVGGVTITMADDYTWLDPAFEKGKTITFTGQQANEFVHYRNLKELDSNLGRMQRQIEFIPAMIDQMRKSMGGDTDYYNRFVPLIKDYMVTDLSADRINKLAEYNLAEGEIYKVPGNLTMGEKYAEYEVDDAGLQEILIKMLYKQKN